jgi:hypothetical protein
MHKCVISRKRKKREKKRPKKKMKARKKKSMIRKRLKGKKKKKKKITNKNYHWGHLNPYNEIPVSSHGFHRITEPLLWQVHQL